MQNSECRVQITECRVQISECRIKNTEKEYRIRMHNTECTIQNPEYRMHNTEYSVFCICVLYSVTVFYVLDAKTIFKDLPKPVPIKSFIRIIFTLKDDLQLIISPSVGPLRPYNLPQTYTKLPILSLFILV